jgi:UDP-glucuronate 4-epimerase
MLYFASMKKNILVTGAAGFIGFHLIQQLHRRGDRVVGFDNFNDYYSPQLKRDRTALLKKEGIEVKEGDLCDLEALRGLVESFKITHVVNLAAQAGVRAKINPQAYVHSNLAGFVNVLEVCKEYSLKLTYASSSSVYGLNSKIPFSESDSTDQQASLYGATKKANESMAFTYHYLYQVPGTGLRFFTVYGPWGRPDMAYFSFAKAIQEEKPIELFNHGKMQRDFTYIDDIVEGTIAAMDLESPCEVFNLGNHRPEELLTFVAILEKHLGKKAKVILSPMQKVDVLTTFADIDHSSKKLGFSPKTNLEIGLKKFVDWYLSYPSKSH